MYRTAAHPEQACPADPETPRQGRHKCCVGGVCGTGGVVALKVVHWVPSSVQLSSMHVKHPLVPLPELGTDSGPELVAVSSLGIQASAVHVWAHEVSSTPA